MQNDKKKILWPNSLIGSKINKQKFTKHIPDISKYSFKIMGLPQNLWLGGHLVANFEIWCFFMLSRDEKKFV